MTLILTSDSANLGDNLGLTPLLAATPCKLRLLDETWMRFTAEVFNGLCEIEWITDKNELKTPPVTPARKPWSRRWLDAQGFTNIPAIPKIKLTEAEIADGQNVANHLQERFGKPLCVIKAVPGRSTERIVPAEVIDRIVAANPEYQFVTFNFGPGHPKEEMKSPPIKNVFELVNLPVRAEASVYHAIGRYVGADTGAYHLMLAVGGKCDVLCPSNSPTYDYDLTHYREDCWLNEEVRVRYHWFQNIVQDGVTGLKLSQWVDGIEGPSGTLIKKDI